jgi:hypothetical protein
VPNPTVTIPIDCIDNARMMRPPVPTKSGKSLWPRSNVGRNQHPLEQLLDETGRARRKPSGALSKDGVALRKGASCGACWVAPYRYVVSFSQKEKSFVTNRVFLQLAKFLHHRLREFFRVH